VRAGFYPGAGARNLRVSGGPESPAAAQRLGRASELCRWLARKQTKVQMGTVRETLSADFVKALEASYQQNGADTLEVVRQNEPAKYLTLITQLMPKPKEEPAPAFDFNDWSREELVDHIAGFVLKHIASDLPKFRAMLRKAERLALKRRREARTAPPGELPRFGMRTKASRALLEQKFNAAAKRKDLAR